MSWKKTTIGEHCTVTSSKRFHLSDRSNSGIPFYCSKEIIQKVNNEEIDNCDYISEEFYEAVAKKYGVPQENDLLVTTRGTIGVPYLYKKSDKFYFADGNLTWMKDFHDTLFPQYLYYWFLSYEGQSKINAIAKGTAQKAVPIAGIKTLELKLPPIEIQRRIADILSVYDDLIANNQKQIKLLEEAAQRLYKEWFVDLHFPGYEQTKIVDGVPEGWGKKSISSISSVLRRGISPKYNDQGIYTVINQKCIRQTVVSFDEARKQEKIYSEELNLQDSDTVICSTGAGTLGRVGQVFGNYNNTTFDSHVTLIRAKKEIGKQYLFQSLKFNQSYFTDMGKGSTNQLELSRETIQNLAVFIPTKDIINRFELLAQALHDRITLLSNEIIRLQESRDRLLPKLMSGEMKI